MGHWQHHKIRAVDRSDQLDLRLRHVFHDALCLQRVDQSCTVPDRLVRRISAYPDAHHPYHSHGEDPFPGNSSQHRTHHDDHHHCRNRGNPTVLLAWRLPGLRPATPDLLDSALSYPSELRRPDAFHEDLVHSTVRVELNAEAAPPTGRSRACVDKDDVCVTASIGGRK